ncbi:helix-turn-helix domain-containing protein [Bdellovibrio sp. NC01]|uniref:helix-turn-helix domain-containing protein n=1 Tax=Bdellovibrio sp. NC01 TaxID=2220073 RepID=UPI00115A577F|nr:helix-turn-helix transcriptional regulator [Bdellovibrio sp. NC01]QDK38168.1 hypothetical protein DOE51_11535 [Bdellovibrio sp. NC01]
MSELGKHIKELRRGVGLSQKKAVELFGIRHSQFLSNIEMGRRLPPMSLLSKMCEVYKVHPDEVWPKYLTEVQTIAAEKALRKWKLHTDRLVRAANGN